MLIKQFAVAAVSTMLVLPTGYAFAANGSQNEAGANTQTPNQAGEGQEKIGSEATDTSSSTGGTQSSRNSQINANETPTGRQGHSAQMQSDMPDGDDDATEAGSGPEDVSNGKSSQGRVTNPSETHTGEQSHSAQMESTMNDNDMDPTEAGGGVGQDESVDD